MRDIESVLPHRYPFLFIDRVVEVESGKWAKAVKNVTRNEWFFNGHFPGDPIMPGVLITEAIAQLSAFATSDEDSSPNISGMIASIKGIKFMAPVVPGDQLVLYFEIISRKGPFLKGKGNASVDGKTVAQVDEIVIMTKPSVRS
jgi:3-hydroxyacyl-[acyl-carrier-protein] dehydratase